MELWYALGGLVVLVFASLILRKTLPKETADKWGKVLVDVILATIGYFKKPPDGSHPKAPSIGMPELRALLQSKFPKAGIYLSDRRYTLCSIDHIKKFIAQDKTNKVGYKPEDYDCDDFALRLAGQFAVKGWSHLAFGIVWTHLHAMNILVDDTKQVWYLEPQTDLIQDTLEAWQGTTIRLIQM